MSNLTQAQETFCNEIVKGTTQYESYCIAYPQQAKTDVRNTIDSNASQLMDNTKIIQRLKELREPVNTKAQRTLEDILDDIESIKLANIGKDDRIALDSLKHEAKLRGFEVVKTDLTSSDGSMKPNIVINTNLKKQEE